MFRRLFGRAKQESSDLRQGSSESARAPSYSPYNNAAIDTVYNLLFCDNPDMFRPKPGEKPAPWQQVLFGKPANANNIRSLAEDSNAEGRSRALAYNWLRAHGHQVPKRILLGTIVELPLGRGLDVLATFSDGGVRYINHTGKLLVFEGRVPQISPTVDKLRGASQAVINTIGPWEKPRLPPPTVPNVRLSFLVSDGLYFGQGQLKTMESDALAAPVIRAATELLQLATKMGQERHAGGYGEPPLGSNVPGKGIA